MKNELFVVANINLDPNTSLSKKIIVILDLNIHLQFFKYYNPNTYSVTKLTLNFIILSINKSNN